MNMKKKALLIVAVAVVAMIAASCTHHTCPAYRGSSVMVETAPVADQA